MVPATPRKKTKATAAQRGPSDEDHGERQNAPGRFPDDSEFERESDNLDLPRTEMEEVVSESAKSARDEAARQARRACRLEEQRQTEEDLELNDLANSMGIDDNLDISQLAAGAGPEGELTEQHRKMFYSKFYNHLETAVDETWILIQELVPFKVRAAGIIREKEQAEKVATEIAWAANTKDIEIEQLVEEKQSYMSRIVELDAKVAAMERAQARDCNQPAAGTRDQRDETPLSGTGGISRRSAKMPDPPLLDDGKKVRFDDWQIRIYDKLDANADHFETTKAEMTYVKSRLEGRAAEHIIARSRRNSLNPYKNVEDIMDHLRSIYEDPYRKTNAQSKLRQLTMKVSDRFTEFISTFTLIVSEAELAKEEWKENLYQRLPPRLQTQLDDPSSDPNVDYENFCLIITRLDNRQNQRFSLKANQRTTVLAPSGGSTGKPTTI
ncbi:uncharacterized protein KD926_000079, partial [Aspergillus affinis]|uniref:uncharacterized protein n=1 Tax=Aspergillus affinis TaxID=1070780 RepID=UPI0022FE275A